MQILFGGTFDPVHNGHVAMIDALSSAFPEASVHVIPNRLPPHRQTVASSRHRLAMLQQVFGAHSQVQVNCIEMERAGPSYSVDTLAAFRQEIGPHEPLILALGADAAAGLGRWHRPEAIAGLAHVCVLDRAGVTADLPSVMGALVETDDAHQLETTPSGYVFRLKTPVVLVSSTAVREKLRLGATQLPVPDVIADYIHTHRLYRNLND